MDINGLINFNKVQKEINNVFEKINESVFGNYKRPSINISQNPKFVFLNVEMKGIDKEDITLKVGHLCLEIQGEKKRKLVKKDSEESSYRGYMATIGLPANVNLDDMKAEYKGNVLRITIPKMKTKIGSKVNID